MTSPQEAIATVATVHELSGLPNRTALEAEVKSLIDSEPGKLGLIAIDLDGIKELNDTLGHPEGDAFLRYTGGVLGEVVRTKPKPAENDQDARNPDIIGFGVAAHASGDEFWIILHDVSEQNEVDAVIERAQEALGELGIEASMGGLVHTPGQTPEVLFAQADAKMYENKISRVPELEPENEQKLMEATRLLAEAGVSSRDVPKYLASIALRKNQ